MGDFRWLDDGEALIRAALARIAAAQHRRLVHPDPDPPPKEIAQHGAIDKVFSDAA